MNYLQKRDTKLRKQFHSRKYVNYRKEAIISKLYKSELVDRLNWLIESGYTYMKHTTIREHISPKTYMLCYNDHLIKLSYYDGKKYYWCTTNYHDDTKNMDTPNSFKMFKQMFKKRTGVNLLKAFGRTDQFFKTFCPKPLYYISQTWEKYKWHEHICKEDYSSHYPWAATKSLPDANTAKTVNKCIKPTAEYPFAFYPDTGHVAVYNEFDSHDWITEAKTYGAQVHVKTTFKTNYSGKDKKTVLMKASSQSIEKEIMHFYNIKANSPKDSAEYNDSKIFLLKFIGMLEQCNSFIYASYPYAHLAAVIKWRANIKMFKTIREIGHTKVIQVCVDGIIHAGDPIGTDKIDLGILNTEVKEARFIHRGLNQYILTNKELKYKEIKHVGLDINTNSNNITAWLASAKVNFIQYIKDRYPIEEQKYGEEMDQRLYSL